MRARAATVEVVHALPDRVRFRLAPGLDEIALWAAKELPGVRSARAAPRARALVLGFDPAQTDIIALRTALARKIARQISVQSATRDGADTAGQGAPVAEPKESDGKSGMLAAAGWMAGVWLAPAPLKAPLAALASWPTLRRAGSDVVAKGLNSHALEGLAVTVSLASADFNAATATSFLLRLGDYLEHSVSRRADALISSLLRPAAHELWVIRDGVEQLIGAEQVVVGDQLVVGAGEAIQIDGTVLSGEAMVNEAIMTGESVSVAKSRGAKVMSGALVEEGRLVIYAEKVGRETGAARIADYVAQCLQAKSETQLEAARLADQLVPVVLKLAGAALVVSGDFRRAASVLQADYACALKLATPVAFKAAIFAAGKSGALIKGAEALERLASAATFIFDKTGTLTSGRLEVTDAITFDDRFSSDDLLALAASVEEHYVHPLAAAVVAAARSKHFRHFDHQDVQFIVAHGVASVIDGRRIVVGSQHFVAEDEGVDISAHKAVVDQLYRSGKTLLFIGFGGELIGLLGLRDNLRASAAPTLRRLRQLGAKRILMLTGDHRDRAEEFAASLGLDECHAELLPNDKAAIIERLRSEGARIAFIGDGVNDAPALAGAEVGVAMARGADLARLTADIALLEDDIAGVAEVKQIANEAMALIKANYRATVGLNTTIIAAAALGALTPVTTAVLHNGVTISILLNALRQRFGARR